MAPVLSLSIAPEPAMRDDPTLSFSPAAAGKSVLDFKERPLRDLSAEAQSFLDSRDGKWGVAVVVPSQGVMYTANGDELTPMASVVKVAIMLATMDRAMKEGRNLTKRELQLLRPMITQSDNDSATALWDELGGGAAVTAYVNSLGISDFVPNPWDAWGASRASAKGLASLFAQLAFGNILNEPMREIALELLSNVTPSQRWGVAAGTSSDPPPGTVIGLKDGWYPARYAWWVNSAGMLLPGDDRPPYTIAVLTRGSPSLEYGIATIEGVAQMVHAELHCDSEPLSWEKGR
ncbi:MAG: serine hydrolase [Chloroflexi bacterium]|nr:serine hydrolase [Chloroflexota bacterium]